MNLQVICSRIGVCSQVEELLGRGGGCSLKSEGDHCSVPHRPSPLHLAWVSAGGVGQVREKSRASRHSHVESTPEREKVKGRGESSKKGNYKKTIIGSLLMDVNKKKKNKGVSDTWSSYGVYCMSKNCCKIMLEDICFKYLIFLISFFKLMFDTFNSSPQSCPPAKPWPHEADCSSWTLGRRDYGHFFVKMKETSAIYVIEVGRESPVISPARSHC